MQKNLWIAVAASLIVLVAAGYTVAKTSGSPPPGQANRMMESQPGRTGGGMMGQDSMMGQGNMMSSGMTNMMMGQALTQEQLEQFARQHGISVEQAKQMTEACTQVMNGETTPEAPTQ